MTNAYLSKVGSKGELFPPSKIRKLLGMKPGMKVAFFIQNNRLIVEPIPNLFDLLTSKKRRKVIDTDELSELRRELSKSAEDN